MTETATLTTQKPAEAPVQSKARRLDEVMKERDAQARTEVDKTLKEGAVAGGIPAMQPQVSPQVQRKIDAILAGDSKNYVGIGHIRNGEIVRYIQEVNNTLYPDHKIAVDGKFGKETAGAIARFQKDHASEVSYQRADGRTVVADKLVGRRTLQAMLKALNGTETVVEQPVVTVNADAVSEAGQALKQATKRVGTHETEAFSALLKLNQAEIASLRERWSSGEFAKGEKWNDLEKVLTREFKGEHEVKLQASLQKLLKLDASSSASDLAAAREEACSALREAANSGNLSWTQVTDPLNAAGELGLSDLVAASKLAFRSETGYEDYLKGMLESIEVSPAGTGGAFVLAYGEEALRKDIKRSLTRKEREYALRVLELNA